MSGASIGSTAEPASPDLNAGTSPRIVYWVTMQLARADITAALQAVEGVTLQITTTLEETLAALPGALGLVLAHGPQEHGRQVMAVLKSPRNSVRWMHFYSAGREGYEELGWPQGVVVTSPGDGVSPAVAEHAMALLLALARCLPELSTRVMSQRAFDRTLVTPRARSLEGATLVIVGYGHIGTELAKRARPFGMRIISVSRSAQQDEWVDEARPMARLHESLAEADAVVLAIALTPETTGLMSDEEFEVCKPGALLVNVARGGVVDTPALERALRSGRLGGAGLDVTEPEPLPPEHPLWSAPNLLISPHYAGAGSRMSAVRLGEGAGGNLRRLMAGEPLMNVVSP